MNDNLLTYQYNKQDILDVILKKIEETILEPSLKEIALQAVQFKYEEFLFSKFLFAHFLTWNKNGTIDNVKKLMASMELFVLACDILDDLQDMDNTTPPWMKIEHKFALTLHPIFMALNRMIIDDCSFSAVEKGKLFQMIMTHEIKSLSGQHADLQNKLISEEEYIHIIERKSGSFVSLACLLGSLQASEDEKEKIQRYATHIGCSAQMENDLLGLSEKNNYKDIVRKSCTLPIIYLFLFQKGEFPFIQDYYNNKIGKEDLLTKLKGNKELLYKGMIQYSKTMQSIQEGKAFFIIERLYANEEDQNRIKNAFNV